MSLERVYLLHGFSMLVLLLLVYVSLFLPLLLFLELQLSAHLLHWLADDSVLYEATLFVLAHYLY